MNNYCSNPIRITRSASHYPHVLVFSLSNFKNWHDSRGSCSPCILYSHYVMMTCLSVTYRILKVTWRLLGHPKYNCQFCHNCTFVNTCMHYYNTILLVRHSKWWTTGFSKLRYSQKSGFNTPFPVSYTHLTLPTICSV